MTIESTEVHEPSDADIDDMRIHMTLHDLRGLVDMNLSIQDVNIIISALEPIHMALTSKITVSGDVERSHKMIKGVFKVKELIEKLEQFQSDESVALYLVDEADVHKWNTEASDIMSMDLGSFVDALDEGMVKWIDEDDEFDLTPSCVNKILDWYPPSWVGGKY